MPDTRFSDDAFTQNGFERENKVATTPSQVVVFHNPSALQAAATVTPRPYCVLAEYQYSPVGRVWDLVSYFSTDIVASCGGSGTYTCDKCSGGYRSYRYYCFDSEGARNDFHPPSQLLSFCDLPVPSPSPSYSPIPSPSYCDSCVQPSYNVTISGITICTCLNGTFSLLRGPTCLWQYFHPTECMGEPIQISLTQNDTGGWQVIMLFQYGDATKVVFNLPSTPACPPSGAYPLDLCQSGPLLCGCSSATCIVS